MADIPTPTVRKLDLTIARLRLLVADLTAREAALEGQLQTFTEQRRKLIDFCLYGDSTLESVLAMLADVEERAGSAEATLRSLRLVRSRASDELESLQLTKGIEEARALLTDLRRREASEAESPGAMSRDELHAEILRLQALIETASERAAQSIKGDHVARR